MLQDNKNQILKILELKDTQITCRLFISPLKRSLTYSLFDEYMGSFKQCYPLGNYEFAEIFLLITRKKNSPEALIFNTCPMGEKYFKNIFYELPLYQVIQAFNAPLLTIAKNHFFKQIGKNAAPNEKFPFIHIPAIQN